MAKQNAVRFDIKVTAKADLQKERRVIRSLVFIQISVCENHPVKVRKGGFWDFYCFGYVILVRISNFFWKQKIVIEHQNEEHIEVFCDFKLYPNILDWKYSWNSMAVRSFLLYQCYEFKSISGTFYCIHEIFFPFYLQIRTKLVRKSEKYFWQKIPRI